MNLANCRKCGKEIEAKSKTCPHCGLKYPGFSEKRIKTNKIIIISFIAFFALMVVIGAINESDSQSQLNINDSNSISSVDLSKAKPYKIFLKENYHSVPGRIIYSWSIISAANTFEERAQTAMKAAMDLQKKGCNVSVVWLEVSPKLHGKGLLLAKAIYARDGLGYEGDSGNDHYTWRVEATNARITYKSIHIAELWYQYQNQFQDAKGIIDESGLASFVAKKLSIDPGQVHLPWIIMKAYQVEGA